MAKDKADDREPVAIEYARTLEPKLSYLTLEVSQQPDVDLEIKQDGKPVGQAVWGMAFPVDPGPTPSRPAPRGRSPGRRA